MPLCGDFSAGSGAGPQGLCQSPPLILILFDVLAWGRHRPPRSAPMAASPHAEVGQGIPQEDSP